MVRHMEVLDINDDRPRRRQRVGLLVIVSSVIVAVGLAVGLGIGLCAYKTSVNSPPVKSQPQCKKHTIVNRYRKAAVAADADVCSKIGTDIMAFKGGSAVDAAIAAMVCVGVYNLHSAGIGGGSIAVVHNEKATNRTGKISVFNFRERAPKAALKDMYVGKKKQTSTTGGLAIGVPGEVNGYKVMHAKYGKLPWKELFQPSIELCEKGFEIGSSLADAIRKSKSKINMAPNLKSFLTDKNNNLMQEGSILKHPKLAKTLRTIADDKTYNTFYDGILADDIVADLKEQGSIITKEDLKDYIVTVREPAASDLGTDTVYVPPPPSSGTLILYMLNILKGYKMTAADIADDSSTTLTYHRIIEAMKYAYAKRSEMGDDAFVNVSQLIVEMTSPQFGESIRQKIVDDKTFAPKHYGAKFAKDEIQGTSHLSVVDSDGLAVSITSTINLYFGSKVMGSRTGILFNDEMDDFSTPGLINTFGVPPSVSNFIEPGKRPMSSMSPCIVVDKNGRAKLIIGASGGTRIITGVFMVLYRALVLGQNIGDAVDATRIHHQLVPNYINYERPLPKAIDEGLKQKGHTLKLRSYMSVVQAIRRVDNYIYALADVRKYSRADGF